MVGGGEGPPPASAPVRPGECEESAPCGRAIFGNFVTTMFLNRCLRPGNCQRWQPRGARPENRREAFSRTERTSGNGNGKGHECGRP